MEWLNYHHLLYFWAVAREGGVGPAGKRLRLSPQTISGQVNALEDALGAPLFERQGRRLVLTETGRTVYGYADEIFALGRELLDAMRGRPVGRATRVLIGIAEVVPKLVAKRLLAPILRMKELQPLQLVCREDTTERLLGELAAHRLDALILDGPIPPGTGIKAFNHLLGETGMTFFATSNHARALRATFPKSLDDFPVLLPTEQAAVRRGLDDWFHLNGIRPRIVAEFDDSALLKVFGQEGLGAFAAPTATAIEVASQFGVLPVGEAESVKERFFVVTMQRRLEHPVIRALTELARTELFVPELQSVRRSKRSATRLKE